MSMKEMDKYLTDLQRKRARSLINETETLRLLQEIRGEEMAKEVEASKQMEIEFFPKIIRILKHRRRS